MNTTGQKIHWQRVVLRLLSLLLLLFLLLSIHIYTYSFVIYSSPADAAIIMGAAVWDGYPSPVLQERIKHAIHLYKAGDVKVIIFTGGVGEGDQLAESEVAKEYAIQHGIPAERIYCEMVSKTTYENLEEAGKILDQQKLTTALIVSDPLHMRRAVTIANDLGIDAYPSPTSTSRYITWKSKLGFLARETYFYVTYLLRRPFIIGRSEQTMPGCVKLAQTYLLTNSLQGITG